MKKILLTGGSGFVGSNVLPFLKDKYDVLAPGRSELDVRDMNSMNEYFSTHEIDVIVHLASPSPIRNSNLDTYERLFEDCLKIFMNIYSFRNQCEKIIYSGSGAEYDKRMNLELVSEEQIGESIPIDDYGRAKYIMNSMARESENIYNLRIFGCFGPREYDSKFIRHAINCCLRDEPITIRQDCYFDYLYVDDYAKFLCYCIDNKLLYHDYNASSGKRILLSDIAEIVRKKMNSRHNIIIKNTGLNMEYSASNNRLISETNIDNLIKIEDGIDKLIEWEKKEHEKKSSGYHY